MDTTPQTPGIMNVLDKLSYPAQKWQITTCAEQQGTDVHTRRALYELPVRHYESAADVVSALPASDGEIDGDPSPTDPGPSVGAAPFAAISATGLRAGAARR